MLKDITFKTELTEILSLEEVSMLFDNITAKYPAPLVALSLYPTFYALKKDIISATKRQRNAELSTLLTEIAERKQQVKIIMWKTLGAIGYNKKALQNKENSEHFEELEQLIYEEEQIVGVYENIIRTLENKEKRIMNGKYQHISKITAVQKKIPLRRKFEELYEKLMEISAAHDNCFQAYEGKILELIDRSVISKKNMVTKAEAEKIIAQTEEKDVEVTKFNFDELNQTIAYIREQIAKDYYQYEPDTKNPDDELIYELMSPNNFEKEENGTVNALLTTDYEEVEAI